MSRSKMMDFVKMDYGNDLDDGNPRREIVYMDKDVCSEEFSTAEDAAKADRLCSEVWRMATDAARAGWRPTRPFKVWEPGKRPADEAPPPGVTRRKRKRMPEGNHGGHGGRR